MAHRIPIQQFYDILSKKHPQNINWYDLYQLNKKEIKHISSIFLSTIEDFSQTLKIKKIKYDISQLPQIIFKNNEKYIKLPNINYEQIILYNYGFLDILKYLNNLAKNLEFDKIHYIIENKIIDVENYCHYHHNRINDSGLYGFIELYIEQYIYFSLLLKDNNIKIQICEKMDFQNSLYDGRYILHDIYLHDFNFPHKKLNELISRQLYYIIKKYNYIYNNDILTNIVQEQIKNKSLDANFLKEYTKYCFQMIYSVYNIMIKLKIKDELNKKIYRLIKQTLMYYFEY